MSGTGYHFRPAIRSEAKLLVGFYAESGCGKTFPALLLALGFAGDMKKVGMIETESGRGRSTPITHWSVATLSFQCVTTSLQWNTGRQSMSPIKRGSGS